MIDTILDEARRRNIDWDRTRHDRVRRALHVELAARQRRSRAKSALRSGLLGAALLALAVRALGGSAEASHGELYSSAPRVAHDDGGYRADVMPD